MDAEFLFHSSSTTFPEGHTDTPEDDPNVAQLPLSHLRSCRLGEDGVPAGQLIEEGDADRCLTPSLVSDIVSLLKSGRVLCRAPG